MATPLKDQKPRTCAQNGNNPWKRAAKAFFAAKQASNPKGKTK